MSRALLDVNVLLALLDADHVDHVRAREWLSREVGQGWASWAFTQNGFVRLISQPRYPSPVPIAQAVQRLSRAVATPHHEWWPCELSLLDDQHFDPARLHGPRQVTDAYLLAMAVQRDGRFVSFDAGISLGAVVGATPDHLVLLR